MLDRNSLTKNLQNKKNIKGPGNTNLISSIHLTLRFKFPAKSLEKVTAISDIIVNKGFNIFQQRSSNLISLT